jgi:hypothetical protein
MPGVKQSDRPAEESRWPVSPIYISIGEIARRPASD